MRSILFAKNSLDEFYEKNKDNKILNLPNELFESVSRITPMVNTDLIIRNVNDEILLSWRNDEHYGIGWHVPGRILRIKETLEQCVKLLIKTEIQVPVIYNKYSDINECILFDKSIRSHFISFLYEGVIIDNHLKEINMNKKEGQAGYLKWFKECPDNFIEAQSMYKKYF